jgi:stage II sporulation protein M
MITSFILGLISCYVIEPRVTEDFVREVSKELRPIIETLSINPIITTLLIFMNNLRVALITFFLGPTLLVPIAVLYVNGFLIGSFLMYSSKPLIENLLLLIPHGVVELPAIILSATSGSSLGIAMIHKYLLKRNVSIKELFIKNLKYLIIAIVMLGIAAFIEVFITPVIPRLLGITS